MLETSDGAIFESNAIARYGKVCMKSLLFLLSFPYEVRFNGFSFSVAVTRLKADNPLYGSSLIDAVSHHFQFTIFIFEYELLF